MKVESYYIAGVWRTDVLGSSAVDTPQYPVQWTLGGNLLTGAWSVGYNCGLGPGWRQPAGKHRHFFLSHLQPGQESSETEPCLSGSGCGSAEVLEVNGKRLSAGLISVMLCRGRRATVSLGAVRGGAVQNIIRGPYLPPSPAPVLPIIISHLWSSEMGQY